MIILVTLGLFGMAMPLAGGLYLLYLTDTRDMPLQRKLRRMAGWLALKPYPAIALWLGLVLINQDATVEAVQWHMMLPAAGLTLWAVLVYRALFDGPTAHAAWTLLTFDTLRWFSTFAATGTMNSDNVLGSWNVAALPGLIAAAMPCIFALVALYVTRGSVTPDDDDKVKHTEDERGEVILLP